MSQSQERNFLINIAAQPRKRRNKCCTNDSRRPSCAIFDFMSIIFLSIFGLAFFFAGVFYIPDYLHGNATNATVTGYDVISTFSDCTWIAFAVIKYKVGNVTYLNNNHYEFSQCARYDWEALNYVKIRFPVGSNVTVWYMIENPGKLSETDPRPMMLQSLIFLGVLSCVVVIWIVHLFSVCCCGCQTWCARESKTFRCYDPFD
jgi:hypothetical protein